MTLVTHPLRRNVQDSASGEPYPARSIDPLIAGTIAGPEPALLQQVNSGVNAKFTDHTWNQTEVVRAQYGLSVGAEKRACCAPPALAGPISRTAAAVPQ